MNKNDINDCAEYDLELRICGKRLKKLVDRAKFLHKDSISETTRILVEVGAAVIDLMEEGHDFYIKNDAEKTQHKFEVEGIIKKF